MRRLVLPLALAALVFGTGAVATAATARSEAARAPAAGTYTARGVVQSFGPGRKFVNIAHEKIEGYMPAMTMPFEPRSPEQLAGIGPGDHVVFTFTATDDGRRLLDGIRKG